MAPEKALAEVDLSKVHIWIQAIGLPVLFVNKENAEKIGNYVGSFVKADLKSDSQRWNRALRIRVEIDVNKPLRDRFVLKKPDGSSILIEIRYERLGEYCYVCGVIGHKLDLCPKTNQNPNPHNFSFGPWLKAENVLIKNPNLQTTLGVLPPPKQARNETFGAKTDPTPKPGATCKGMEICPMSKACSATSQHSVLGSFEKSVSNTKPHEQAAKSKCLLLNVEDTPENHIPFSKLVPSTQFVSSYTILDPQLKAWGQLEKVSGLNSPKNTNFKHIKWAKSLTEKNPNEPSLVSPVTTNELLNPQKERLFTTETQKRLAWDLEPPSPKKIKVDTELPPPMNPSLNTKDTNPSPVIVTPMHATFTHSAVSEIEGNLIISRERRTVRIKKLARKTHILENTGSSIPLLHPRPVAAVNEISQYFSLNSTECKGPEGLRE
ncbi:UNVERIFIED_CONTAM: hypothetical protein Sangu_2841200 [Sesamum angustifolium]|uniref:Zinc knuckle CX2CX4HX4C domain-containing protein n=1 Tax=Sesamum angustifolium TaxID=2727405 RepID=A0AAW2IQ02_9LAMI